MFRSSAPDLPTLASTRDAIMLARGLARLDRVPVKLPTDVLRTALTSYEQAVHTADQDALRLPEGEAGRALFAGALCAVLQRYTQQAIIAIDVLVDTPDQDERSSVAFDCNVEPESQVSALAGQAVLALECVADPGARASQLQATANVAVTFSLARSPSQAIEREREVSRYDLHFVVLESEPRRLLTVYNASLFRASTVARIAGSVLAALSALAASPELSTHRLPLLSEADARTMLVDWDSGSLHYEERPVHRLFEGFARAQPDAVALRFGSEQLSYAEVSARANRLAHYLIQSGITQGTRVAVCVAPSFDVLIGLLAVFKVGAVYVPLDPTHPEALIATILDEAAPGIVLTQSKISALTNPGRFRQFCFDTDFGALAALPDTVPEVEVTCREPAYLLYTSGTTGKPKGVVATHGNLAHYLHAAREKYGFRDSDRFCSLARYTFSISMFELLSPMTCGGSLRLLIRDDVLAPERFASTLDEVTVVHAGPSLLGNLFRHLKHTGAGERTFPNLRHASSGGDIVPPSVIEEMKLVFPNAELFVIYGCTEISCMGCTYPIDRAEKVTRSFVGKAFPDVTVRITDAYGNLAPVGVIGEICFAGKGVVQGYLQRPELTAEKFVAREDKRFYLTGDMGRLHEDGNVEILGRRDYQVQLRGIRVELPGIENVVREVGLAAQCAVAVKRLDENDVRLVAFVVAPKENGIAAFRRVLAQHLPDYMLPQGLVVLDALPLTRNGKLDRGALDEIPWKPEVVQSGGAAPTSRVEEQIAAAFAQALGRHSVGIDDDFFDLGGHSLLAVAVLEKLENVLGLTLPPGLLFEHPTVRALAAETRDSQDLGPKPIPLGKSRNKPPVFLLLGVHLYRELAKQLDDEFTAYGIYADSELVMLGSEAETPSVTGLAREYVSIMRKAQPKGPYRVAGMSFGGIVAYEVAQQLRDAGEQVAFLGLIDAILPEKNLGRFAKLKRLVSRPSRESLQFFSTKVTSVVRDLLGKKEAPTTFERYSQAPDLSRREQLREAAYFKATEGYMKEMRPYEGRAVLIVAGERIMKQPLESPSCGFKPYVSELQVHTLGADHLALLEQPVVGELGQIFLRNLHLAQHLSSGSDDGAGVPHEPESVLAIDSSAA